jgi:LPXTG-motif cell wall-anchored protein
MIVSPPKRFIGRPVLILIFLLLSAVVVIPVASAASDTTIIGFRWDTNDPSPRLYQIDSTGATIPAKDTTFWNNWAVTGNMKTVVVTPTNSIQYSTNNRGDGLDLTGASGDVMVEIPRFYTRSTYANGNFYYYISPLPAPEFTVAPMFNQRGYGTEAGTPAPYYYVGRYDASLAGNKLQSATGKEPAVSMTIGQARTWAEAKGAGWGITNIWTLSGLRQLFYTEMLTLDSQTAWTKSKGIVDYGIADGPKNSGADSIDTQINANSATGSGTGANGYTPVSYRGIENLWGNVWQFQDGFNAIQGKTYVISPTGLGVTGQKTTFKDLLDANDVQSVGSLILTTGYQTNLISTDVARSLFLPLAVGGSNSTYLTDYFWSPLSTNSDEPNILMSGGRWLHAEGTGIGGLNAGGNASDSGAGLGARVEFRRSTLPRTPEASASPGDNTGPFSTINLAVIGFLLLLAGGGFAFYRMKNKPSGGQPPGGNGVPATTPPHSPTGTSPEGGYSVSSEDLLNRIASVEQKAASLSRFKSPVQALITKTREEYHSGEYDSVQKTLDDTENAISALGRYEAQLTQWNTEGYTTTSLESLKTDNVNTITTVFQDFERDLATLEQLGRRVEDLKRSFSQGDIDPSISQRIAGIAPQLKDPRNIPGIKRETEALEQELRDQQVRSRQQRDAEQLLISMRTKAEKLARYAPLLTGSFKEAEDQNTAGQFEKARKTLQTVEGTINTLLEDEASLTSWKAQGYDTTGLETLRSENAGEVIAAFKQYDQTVRRLETVAKELASKKVSFPQLLEQTGTADLVLSIERDLNDPAQLDSIERDYQQIESAIRQWEDQQKSIEKDLQEQAERVEREVGSPVVKRETASITKCIRQGDIPRAQELFQGLAEQQLSQVNTTLGELRADGAVVAVSSESINQQIAGQHYSDAIIDSEKAIAELMRVEELYTKAKVMRPAVTGPVIIALYNCGNYEEFIRASEEEQRQNQKVTELKDKGQKLLEKAEHLGQVPESVRSKLGANDIPTIQSAITELEAFSTTAKPELDLTLGHTQFIADDWDKLTIQLANRGNAHVSDLKLTFSEEFDTKWLKTTTVNAGATTSLDIGIRPKAKGKIPLEITAMYRDNNNKDYREAHEFWINVVEKGSTTTSGAHSTPPGQFTPGPATLKQLPPDLSDRYTESEFIGKGGFARVFKAKRKDGKIVAVKIPLSLDAITGKSFIAEMQNWTKLSHTNIVKLYDFNIMPLPYFEEELCDSSLADQNKPIENEEAAWILFNICEGLKFAHGQKIIHRDLKPQNILLKN